MMEGADDRIEVMTVKVWNRDKTVGKLVRTKSFEDLLMKAKEKLQIEQNTNIKILLEDGCEVDDTDCLLALATTAGESPLSVFVIQPNESLCLPSTSSGLLNGSLNQIMDRIKQRKVQEEDGKNKTSLMLKMTFGLMNYNNKEKRYQAVRSGRGGGTRTGEVLKNVSYNDILTYLKGIFFPSGKNPMGKSIKFDYELGDINGNVIGITDFDVTQCRKRLNLMIKEKSVTILSDSSDEELLLPPPWKRQNQHGTAGILEQQFDFLCGDLHVLQNVEQDTSIAASSAAASSASHVNADTPTVSFRVPDECFVCRDRKKECFLIPCGHLYCTVCAVELFERHSVCPLCRGKIMKIGELRQ